MTLCSPDRGRFQADADEVAEAAGCAPMDHDTTLRASSSKLEFSDPCRSSLTPSRDPKRRIATFIAPPPR
jgi:hypothetical protein